MKQNSVKENSTMSERLPYLYIEHAIVEQCDSSVQILREKERIPLPIATLGWAWMFHYASGYRGYVR